MMPTAGGQYHWVSVLAPRSTKRFLSYTTGKSEALYSLKFPLTMLGWITVVGWVAGTAAIAFFVSSLLQALLVLNIPTYEALRWQGTLIFWAILLVCVVMNTLLSKALPSIEIAVLILHVLGFFAIIIPLIYLAPKGSAYDIFTTFQNGGGWSSQALSFFIGLNGNAIAFVGEYLIVKRNVSSLTVMQAPMAPSTYVLCQIPLSKTKLKLVIDVRRSKRIYKKCRPLHDS